MKKILILFLMLLPVILIHTNELMNVFDIKTENILVNANVNNDYKLYSDDGTDYNKKVKGFTAMAVTGTVFFGLSWFFTIPGIVLMVKGYNERWRTEDGTVTTGGYNYNWVTGGYDYSSSTSSTYSYYEDWTLFSIGAGVFSLGLVFLLVGTPLMIAGFALRHHYKGKISLSIYNSESDINFALSAFL